MPESLVWLLIAAGLLVAGWLGLRIRRNWPRRDAPPPLPPPESLVMSLDVICRCMLERQVDLMEGCLRIEGLIHHLDAETQALPALKGIRDIARQGAALATHEQRKALSTEARRVEDQQRTDWVRGQEPAIDDACRALRRRLSELRRH